MPPSRSKIVLLTFLSAFTVAPVGFWANGQEIRFERLGVEHGLSDNNVFAIHQDTKGFMWFGTENGLNRYDGYRFAVYRPTPLDSQSISFNTVGEIFEDRSGTMWISGPGAFGLDRFDRATERFTHYLPNAYVSSRYEDAQGALWFATSCGGLFRYDKTTTTFKHYSLVNDTLSSICGNPSDNDRTLLVGTAQGVVKFDQREGTWTHLQGGPSGRVKAMIADRAGNFWIGNRDGLYAFNSITNICSFFPFGRQIERNPGDNEVQILYEDREGLVWIGIAGAGIAMFDPSTRKYRHFPNAGYQAGWANKQAICEDRSGALWVVTAGRGLQKYDRSTGLFSTYLNDPRDAHSPSSNLSNAIYEDRSGTLWIGTWGGGLSRIDPSRKAFHQYTADAQKGLTNTVVLGFAEDRSGMLWITTMGGLNKFDRSTEVFTHFGNGPKNAGGLSTNSTGAVLEDSEGSLWIAAAGQGLQRLDPSRNRFMHYVHDPQNPHSLGSNTVLSLCEDRAGGLWVGYADNGAPLDRLDRHSGTVIHYRVDKQDSTAFWGVWSWDIHEDTQGYIWICAGGAGLDRFDRQTGLFSHYRSEPKSQSSLSHYSARSIHEDGEGTLWIGTPAGLNKFDRSTGTFTQYTIRDGLESDHIGAILHDDNGCLWMITSCGISKFDPRTAVFRNYNEDDGVSIHAWMIRPGHRTRNGEMYFGGTNGFVRFHPDSIVDNPNVPSIVITKFLVSDRLATLDTVITEKKLIELSHDEDSFAFEFSSLSYANPAKNQYAYKLDGFDKHWIESGTRRYASYTNLNPGTYVFSVKGSNNDGRWNEVGTSVSIRIHPPFWQRWWFRSFVAAMILLVLILFHRYRVARLLEIERLRVRISTDLHDEIGSNLSAIALQSDLVRSGVSAGDNNRLMEISRLARQMANDLRDIVWTINPGLDGLNDIVDRMKIISSTMLGGMSYAFQGQNGTSTDKLEMEFRRNILLMYKEVLHNIVEHARATQVRILINQDLGRFTITIEDNGVGFDTTIPSSGYGLSNLKSRASSIGATLEIDSAPDKGTQVRIAARIP